MIADFAFVLLLAILGFGGKVARIAERRMGKIAGEAVVDLGALSMVLCSAVIVADLVYEVLHWATP